MRKFKKFSIILILLLICLTCILSGCTFNNCFFRYEVVYYTEEEPFIEFVGNKNTDGKIIIGDITYEVDMAWENDGTGIDFYYADSEFHEDSAIIWECETKLKKGLLYMTVTVDNVSNYVGQTFVLKQRPIDEY